LAIIPLRMTYSYGVTHAMPYFTKIGIDANFSQ
jgi:hypothetical protein